MNRHDIYKAVSDAVHVVWHGGWVVMVPWDDKKLAGARTEVRCLYYQQAVAVARRRKVALAVLHMTNMDSEEYNCLLAALDSGYHDMVGDWRAIARQVAATYTEE